MCLLHFQSKGQLGRDKCSNFWVIKFNCQEVSFLFMEKRNFVTGCVSTVLCVIRTKEHRTLFSLERGIGFTVLQSQNEYTYAKVCFEAAFSVQICHNLVQLLVNNHEYFDHKRKDNPPKNLDTSGNNNYCNSLQTFWSWSELTYRNMRNETAHWSKLKIKLRCFNETVSLA